jgi:hypothetical protein
VPLTCGNRVRVMEGHQLSQLATGLIPDKGTSHLHIRPAAGSDQVSNRSADASQKHRDHGCETKIIRFITYVEDEKAQGGLRQPRKTRG